MLGASEISRKVHAVLAESLVEFGFESPNGRGVFTRRRGAGVRDQIVMLADVSDLRGPIWVTANLRVQAVQPPAAPGRRPPPIALNWNIGYLTPARNWQQWPFEREQFDETEAQRLANCLITYGLPWLERFGAAADIRAELESKQPSTFSQLRRSALPRPGEARAS